MNGLSTLNRLLGKRNKDVSKSTSNLSRSTTNLDASSHYNNKVIQLPIVANAPFEQTFRVTVLLPRDQLYVARVGAKTKLSTLLEMVCSDKLLDAQKYVFRHPADYQQGFELDMNIGEVGLSEVRLMSRKELEALRNSDYRLSTSDIFRMHQKSARETSGGTSVSSSDLSRTSKVPLKTTSPYSSTNSLNSMDSSGVSSSSRGGGGGHGVTATNGTATNGHSHPMAPPVAPTRKKRLAPRPPSQNSIPEARVPTQHANGSGEKLPGGPDDHIFKEPQLPPYSRQNFHVSTPNLYERELKSADIINNNNNGTVSTKNTNGNGYSADVHNNNNTAHDTQTTMLLEEEDRKNLINTKTSYSTLKNRPTSMYIIREPDTSATLQRASENGGSMVDIHHQHHHSRASSSCSDAKDPRDFQDMPEPTPRKRLNSSAKKSKAPAPPPRAKATTITTPVPTPSPRALTRSTLDLLRDNDAAISETDSNFSSEPDDTQRNRESRLNAVNGSVHRAPYTPPQQNVSKVMLNVEQAPPLNDPVVTSTTPDSGERRHHQKTGSTSSSVSIKIVGNGSVGSESSPKSSPTAPIVSKVQIGGGPPTPREVVPTSPGDNSSDEEIKIYNIESGKALIKKKPLNGVEPHQEQQSKKATSATIEGTQKSNALSTAQNGEAHHSNGGTGGGADEEQWTYKLPAPPKFADASIKTSDYDERGQFYRPASTFVDNTTLRSDMLTVVSDEQTERIEPFIQERLQTMLDLTAAGGRDDYSSARRMPELRPESPLSVSTETDATTHVSEEDVRTSHHHHISSDVEDGYRVGGGAGDGLQEECTDTKGTPADSTQEAREVWLQTLEKRREKIIEGELATLSESIAGGKATNTEKTVSRSQSVSDRKSSVMSELNQLLRDGVELSRKEETEIVGVNRSSLANFKISTYSSSENKENIITSTSTTTVVKEEKHVEVEIVAPVATNGVAETKQHINVESEETDVIVRRKISVDSATFRKPHSLTQSSDEDDAVGRSNTNGYAVPTAGASAKKELAPVKRRSLTMLNKSPRVINRSDSFHSTRSDYIQSLNSPASGANGTGAGGPSLHLTPRSTSYISLIGAQRWENRAAINASLAASAANSFNRRKSASELSICDSPSLQSLEVIKNILNTSRKNSASNLYQTNGSAAEGMGTPGGQEEPIVLPSMAAIKRNSFTDISTLVQLNGGSSGKSVLQMQNGGGIAAVRKDSIEEAKVEQEPEPEVETTPAVSSNSQDANKTEDVKEVEKLVEKIAEEPMKEEVTEKLIVKETVEKKILVEEEPKVATPTVDLASESKSDDEKLQNKQQQQHHNQQSPPDSIVKEPQTTVVNITTTSTVVSESSTTNATATNESDTKKWTYQGPPTISFATWNERPKIDVSIKSDRDYRFGGSSTLPRGFRNVNNVSSTKISIGPGGSSSTTTTTTTVESSSSSASSGYVRRTIHEVDQSQPQEGVASNVPSAVSTATAVVKLPATSPKPAPTTSTPPGERLPIVRAVEYKKNVGGTAAITSAVRPTPPPVEPKPTFFYETFHARSDSTGSAGSAGATPSAPATNVTSVSIGTGGTNISRLSFGTKPPSTMVMQPTVRGFKSLDIEPTTVAGTGAAMPRLRPVSMIDTSVTLRKTTVPAAASFDDGAAPASLPFSQHTLRRTGLKDKILAKDPPTVVPPAPVRPVTLPPPPAPMPPPQPPTTVPKVTSQPVVRGAIVKKGSPATTPASADPRTALLDAIRSFNKDSLRKD